MPKFLAELGATTIIAGGMGGAAAGIMSIALNVENTKHKDFKKGLLHGMIYPVAVFYCS